MLKRWHWVLNAALMARDDPSWSLSFVLRTAQRKEFTASPAKMVYGENLRLSTDPVLDIRAGLGDSGTLRLLRDAVSKLRPTPLFRHATTEVNTFRDMETCLQVLIRMDVPRRPLQPPYEGPFRVLERGEHSFKLDVRRFEKTPTKRQTRPLNPRGFSWGRSDVAVQWGREPEHHREFASAAAFTGHGNS